MPTTRKKRVTLVLDEDFFDLVEYYIKAKKNIYRTKQRFFVEVARNVMDSDPVTNKIRKFKSQIV
jgi:hypothetical protein